MSFHLEIVSEAKCEDDLMDHVIEKNSSHVLIGDLKPRQSYLITALDQWKVGRRQGVSGDFLIQEVNKALAKLCNRI